MTSQETTSEDHPFAAPEAQFQLRFERFSLFVEEFASRISLGGMFLKSREPRPVSTVISFDIKLADGFRLIQGTGEVVWMRPDGHGPEHPAGMGVRFHSLDDTGRELVLKLLEEHLKTGGEPFDIDERPFGAIDNAEEAQAAVASAFPPLPGAEDGQAGLDFDAPWGEKLPELPQEILDEEPTVLGQMALPIAPPEEPAGASPPVEPLGEPPVPAPAASPGAPQPGAPQPSTPLLDAGEPESLGFAFSDPATQPGPPPMDPTPAPPAAGFDLAEEALEELESLPDFDLDDGEGPGASPPGFPEAMPETGLEPPIAGSEDVPSLRGSGAAFETAKTPVLGLAMDPSGSRPDAQRIPDFDPDHPTVELQPASFDPGVIPPADGMPAAETVDLPSFDAASGSTPPFDAVSGSTPPFDAASGSTPSFELPDLDGGGDLSAQIDPGDFEAPTLAIQRPQGLDELGSEGASPPPEGDGAGAGGEGSWPDLPPLGAPDSFAPDLSADSPHLSDPEDLPDPVVSETPAFPPSAAPAFSPSIPSPVDVESENEGVEEPGTADAAESSALYPVQDYEDDLDKTSGASTAPTWKNALLRSAKPLGILAVLALAVAAAFWFRGPIASILGLGGPSSDPAQALAPSAGDDRGDESLGGETLDGETTAEEMAPGQPGVGLEARDLGAEAESATGLESLEPLAADPTAPEVIQVGATASSDAPEPPPTPLPSETSTSRPPPRAEPAARVRSSARAATVVMGIAARREPSGTRVTISLNGEAAKESLVVDSLDYAPDRQQLRILGIEAPYFPAEIEIGSPELSRVRTGYHEGAGSSELRLVFDFSGPGFVLGDVRQEEDRVELLVRRP